MYLLEKFNRAMEVSESKKARVEKAMHSLLVEWKNLEHAHSSTQRLLQDCCMSIQSRQERLNTLQQSVTSSSHEFEEIKKSLEERIEEVESREKGSRVMHEEIIEELESKMKKLDFVKGVLGSGVRDFEVRERKIEGQMKVVEGFFQKFCLERRDVDRIKGFIEERFEEVKLKEKDIEVRERELSSCVDELDGKMKNVAEKENGFAVKEKSIKNREIKLDMFMADCALKMKNVEEKAKELEIMEKSIENHKIELDRDFVEFAEKMKNMVEKEKEVELKEKNNKNRENVLDGIVDEIDLSQRNVIEKEKEVEFKEKIIEIHETNLNKAWVELDMKLENVEKEEKEIELKKKSIKNEEKEIELRKKSIENEEKKLELKKKDIRKREIKLEKDLVEFNVKMKNVMETEIELGSKEKIFEIRDRELDGALVEFDLIKKNVEERVEELEVKEKSIENHRIELESREKEVNLIQISCEERCRKLVLEKEKLEEKIKELEIKNKTVSSVGHSIVKPEPWSDDGSYADIRFSVTMDGNNLLLYLINHKRDLDSMTDEVYKALGLSMDPAKLVLDAMQGFYAKKEDEEFEDDVVCRSSILLLEQLRRISPHIQSYLKKAALELANKWKEKMKSSMEVIVFLQLLASYRLESSFHPEEFLSLFEIIDQTTEISELFQLLGYVGIISDLITSLIQKGHRLQAIRYIYGFKLVEKFPPVPILKDHISFRNVLAEKIHVQKSSDAPEGNVIGKQLASLRAVVKCIKDHQLEVEYPPESLLAKIQQLKEHSKKNAKRANMPKKSGQKRHAAGSDLGPKATTRGINRKCRRTEPLAETS